MRSHSYPFDSIFRRQVAALWYRAAGRSPAVHTTSEVAIVTQNIIFRVAIRMFWTVGGYQIFIRVELSFGVIALFLKCRLRVLDNSTPSYVTTDQPIAKRDNLNRSAQACMRKIS